MRVWIDPKETAAGGWGDTATAGDDEPATPVAPVVERALSASPPIQYTGAFLTPETAERTEGRTHEGYTRVQFNCAVDRGGTVKLTARGYLWVAPRPTDGSNHCSRGRRIRPRPFPSARTTGGTAHSVAR